MSLENSITELTSAVKTLLVALNENTAARGGSGQTTLPLTATATEDPAPAPTEEKPKTRGKKTADAAPTSTLPPVETSTEPAVTLATLREVSQKHLDAGGSPEDIEAVAAKFGAQNLRTIPVDKYPEALVLLQALKVGTKPASSVAPTSAPTVTLEDVKTLATKLRDDGHGPDIVVPLNKKHGIQKASLCPPEKIAVYYADLQAAAAKLDDSSV